MHLLSVCDQEADGGKGSVQFFWQRGSQMDAFQTKEYVSWAPVGIWICLYGGSFAHWQAESQVDSNIINLLNL